MADYDVFDTYAFKANNASITNVDSVTVNTANLTVNSQPLNVLVFGVYFTGSGTYTSNTEETLFFSSSVYRPDPENKIILDTTTPPDYKSIIIDRPGYYNVCIQLTLDFNSPVEDYGYIGIKLDSNLFQTNNFTHVTGSYSQNGQYAPITLNSLIYVETAPSTLEVVSFVKNNSYRVKETSFTGNTSPASYIFITSV